MHHRVINSENFKKTKAPHSRGMVFRNSGKSASFECVQISPMMAGLPQVRGGQLPPGGKLAPKEAEEAGRPQPASGFLGGPGPG